MPSWQPTRLNARYHAALRLAGLVLRATSVEHGAGVVAVNGFLLDMPKLFEDFVTVALRESLESAFGGRVVAQARHYLDVAGTVLLKPDSIWRRGGTAARYPPSSTPSTRPRGHPATRTWTCTSSSLTARFSVYGSAISSTRRVTRPRRGTSSAKRAPRSSATP